MPVHFLVDSGATYSLLPEADWRAIGLEPMRTLTFALSDGTMIERRVSECHVKLDVGEGTSDSDYEGKEVKGKVVLASGSPSEVHRLAVWDLERDALEKPPADGGLHHEAAMLARIPVDDLLPALP